MSSKFARKYNFNAKGVMYIEDGVISVENEETGELVEIHEFLNDFVGKEVTLSVAYAEDI